MRYTGCSLRRRNIVSRMVDRGSLALPKSAEIEGPVAGRKRVAVIGHSFVRRLDSDMQTDRSGKLKSDFGLAQCRVQLRGVGGYRVNPSHVSARCMSTVRHLRTGDRWLSTTWQRCSANSRAPGSGDIGGSSVHRRTSTMECI